MTTYTIRVTADATDDIDRFFTIIAARSAYAAGVWYAGIRAVFVTLQRLPERCPMSPEGERHRRPVRETYYGKRQNRYRILFDVVGGEVRILRVRHGKQRQLRRREL